MESIQELIQAQQYEKAWRLLFAEAREVQSYETLLRLCRLKKKLKQQSSPPSFGKRIKVAVLGGSTVEMFEEPLALMVESLGLGCDVFLADYNTFAQEMMNPQSATVVFRPDVALVLGTSFNLPKWPEPGTSLEQVEELVSETVDHWLTLCSSLHRHHPCEVVLNNFHLRSVGPMGNMASKIPWDANTFLKKVNLRLGERAPSYVHIHDVELSADRHGTDNWFDTRYWYHAKQPVSFQCLVTYIQNLTKIIGAIFGKSGKCLVLDLDNTLWGGVVGDDGPEGLAIGEGSALGEAYLAFQEYVLQLKNRGILLAVCSKNEEENARAAFRKRPEMLLQEKDFVSFKANWVPKSENILSIARELNIGTDSMVFVDDNPAERELVRQHLPEVKVLELTEDPTDYPRLLDRSGWFEITTLSAEDTNRTAQYQQNSQREAMLSASGTYADYLASLQQEAVVAPFQSIYVERISQLINKSNQFNLTTKRMSQSEVEQVMSSPDSLHLYVKLRDCFGDNGLISVLIGTQVKARLVVDIWLMSCRVLKRGVEQLLSNVLVEQCRERGISVIHGVYIPTPKNKLVQNHYQDLGYSCFETKESGEVSWELRVDQYTPFEVEIVEKGESEYGTRKPA